MIYLGYLCQAVLVAVSLAVLRHIYREWIEAGLPTEAEKKRLRILSMAVRKER